MRTVFTITFLLASQIAVPADTLQIGMNGRPELQVRNPEDVDWLRTHLVFVFDLARHHCQDDSESPWKPSQEEIQERIPKVKGGSHLELTFSLPTPITVESKKFLMRKLWVSIRESDWATFDWMFETPEGRLVALGNVEGAFNRKLGPIIQMIAEDPSEQDDTVQPATPADSTSGEDEKPEPESDARSQ